MCVLCPMVGCKYRGCGNIRPLCYPELLKIFSFKPGVGQRIVLCALPAVGILPFLSLPLWLSQLYYFPVTHQHLAVCAVNTELDFYLQFDEVCFT